MIVNEHLPVCPDCECVTVPTRDGGMCGCGALGRPRGVTRATEQDVVQGSTTAVQTEGDPR